jgi:HEPN domain-containing protein
MPRRLWIEFEEGEETHDVFLTAAKALLEAGYYSAAVVSAQTACEVITERAIDFWILDLRMASDVWDMRLNSVMNSLMEPFQTYNLANDRLRRLYVVLSEDAIHQEPFWERFKEHVDRRHRVVHQGYVTTKEEAEQSLAVAEEFVEHVKGTLPSGPD